MLRVTLGACRPRSIIRLLCLLLVPVVLLSSTRAAEAAEVAYSDPADFTMEITADVGWGGSRIGPWLHCNGSAAYRVERVTLPGLPEGDLAAIIFGTIHCYIEHGFNDDPNADELHDNDWTLTFQGERSDTPGMPGCSSSDHSTGDIVNGWDFATGTYVPHDCLVDEVCLEGAVTRDWPAAPDSRWEFDGCSPVGMGAQPELSEGRGTCEFGNPTDIYTESIPAQPPFEPHYGHDVQGWFTRPGGTTHKGWLFDARYSTTTGASTPGTKIWRNGPMSEAAPRMWQLDGSLAWWRQGMPPGSGNLYQASDRGAEDAVGVWVWVTDPNYGDQAAWRQSKGLTLINSYTYGDTDPENCVFYFGPKFRDDPNSTLDEPWGSLETDMGDPPPPDTTVDPPGDRGGCDFSFTDPSTWATGGICALVGLITAVLDVLEELLGLVGDLFGVLGELLDAVLGLVADLLAGIADLFIPSDGFMDAKMDELRDDFDNTTPGNYLEAVTAIQIPGGSSSCAGPTVNLDVLGSPTNWQPLNACSGATAQLASLARLALSLSFAIGGGLLCLRILGRAFGWDPVIGSGGSA